MSQTTEAWCSITQKWPLTIRHPFGLRSVLLALVLILSAPFTGEAQAADAPPGAKSKSAASGDTSAEAWLFEEPLAQTRDPHFFDWWQSRFDIELGASEINESNNFRSSSYNLGLMYGLGTVAALRLQYRHVDVSGSASSDLVGQTPFAQAAQSARSEVMLGFLFPLLAGRSFTPFSPWIGDVDHVLSFTAGAHDAFYPSASHPFGGPAPAPLAGQRPITYHYAYELGLQFKVGLPHTLSAFFEFNYEFPMIPWVTPDLDLLHWSTIGGGLAWSFGG